MVLWARSDANQPEEGKTRVKVVTPDDEEALSPELGVDLTEAMRVRSIGHLVRSPFVVRSEGSYRFKVEAQTTGSDWAEMFEVPLWIAIQAEEVS